MRKILLTTTALIGFAATAANAGGSHMPAETKAPANTGGLTVMVGGYVDVQGGIADQDSNAGVTGGSTAGQNRDAHITNDTEIHVTAAGSTENFDYGAVVELNADVDSDQESDGGNADKAYIFVEGDNFGRVELGGNAGASSTLEVDASNIARATGGIDGDWDHYVDTDGVDSVAGTNETGSIFRFAPNLTVADDDATAADAEKVTYYTPRIGGAQVGVSYTPDTGDLGSSSSLSLQNNSGQFENVFTGGINYQANLEGVGLTVAAVAESGESEATAIEDLSSYSVGGSLEFEGFSVAGNWADLGDSGLATTATQDDQNYWTAGAAHANGPYGVSVTYIASENPGNSGGTVVNETSNVVVGADYQLAPGLTPYVEAAFFELDDANSATVDNDGSVVLLGAELAF